MSDSYQALIDWDATAQTASALADRAIGALIEQNIILADPNPDCVLGTNGYPPGPALRGLYDLGEHECCYWDLATNGVEVTVGRWINMFAIPMLEWIVCPHCEAKYRLERQFGDRFGEEIGRWLKEYETSAIVCESCGEGSRVDKGQAKPHLGFSILTFQFWNWPSLNAPTWKIDLPDVLSAALGHGLTHTWGRL